MKTKFWVALISSVIFAVAAFGQEKTKAEPKAPEGVTWEKEIVFGKGGETELHLDIARPKEGGKPLPCIVVIHGGGWRGGNFKVHGPQIFSFAIAGNGSATVHYRL